MRCLFDTSLVLDYLRGIQPADAAIERCQQRAITLTSWLEIVMASPAPVEQSTRYFLQSFQRIPVNEAIAERALGLMKRHPRLRLRHAVPWAAAQAHSFVFVAADFPNLRVNDESLYIPYRTQRSPRQSGGRAS